MATQDDVVVSATALRKVGADLRNDAVWQVFDAIGQQPAVAGALKPMAAPTGGRSGTLLVVTQTVAWAVHPRPGEAGRAGTVDVRQACGVGVRRSGLARDTR